MEKVVKVGSFQCGLESIYTLTVKLTLSFASCMYCIFPEMKLRGLVPSSYIDLSMIDLYIPWIGLPIWLQKINHSQIRECGSYERELILYFWK